MIIVRQLSEITNLRKHNSEGAGSRVAFSESSIICPFNVSIFILRVVTDKINTMEVGQVSDADLQRSVEDTTMHNLQSIGSIVHCFL